MQWDFWTLSPDSAHPVTWLMGDRGIPRTWRHMNGYSSHTYSRVAAAGRPYLLGEVISARLPGWRGRLAAGYLESRNYGQCHRERKLGVTLLLYIAQP